MANQTILFIWEQFGPYHLDRCNAVARALGGGYRVVGIEIAETSPNHLWNHPPPPADFRLVTLFKGNIAFCSSAKILVRLLMEFCRIKPSLCFACHYERVDIILAAFALKLFGIPVIAMQESKFDDKPRRWAKEALKSFLFLPYAGVIVGGRRTRGYMEFLGFKADRIAEGYDTVSMERIRLLSDIPPAPEGYSYQQRHFTIVARLIEKKNLFMALDAYERYSVLASQQRRELHICGDGPLRAALENEAVRRGLSGIRFCGILQPDAIPPKLARSLALILPSTEEQWGLVANEAVALGLPLLLSNNCGAADSLLRSGVNGFGFEPDNAGGLAYFMDLLGRDEKLWRRMCEASLAMRPLADTQRFHEGVQFFIKRAGLDAR